MQTEVGSFWCPLVVKNPNLAKRHITSNTAVYSMIPSGLSWFLAETTSANRSSTSENRLGPAGRSATLCVVARRQLTGSMGKLPQLKFEKKEREPGEASYPCACRAENAAGLCCRQGPPAFRKLKKNVQTLLTREKRTT